MKVIKASCKGAAAVRTWGWALERLSLGTADKVRTSGALRADRLENGDRIGNVGRLHGTAWVDAFDRLPVEAVAYSYATPVAVSVHGTWVTFDISKSATSSVHRGTLERAGAVRALSPHDIAVKVAGLTAATLWADGMDLATAVETAKALEI